MDLVMALLVANPAQVRAIVVATAAPRTTAVVLTCAVRYINESVQRLGSGRDGIKAIMGHAWFSGVQWKSLMRKRVLPPIIPQVSNKYDVSNFDEVWWLLMVYLLSRGSWPCRCV